MNNIKLGAINKKTGKYEYISQASKNNNYTCPECNNDVIFRKGNINVPHFSHKACGLCYYYDKPNESEIHKRGKILMKKLLKTKNCFILKQCNKCNKVDHIVIDKYNKNSKVKLEYSFEFNSSQKRADVCYLENNKIKYIFEIFYKHKTEETSRPDPWFEIDATELLSNYYLENDIEIKCCRDNYLCNKCKDFFIVSNSPINYKSIFENIFIEKDINKVRNDYIKIFNYDEENNIGHNPINKEEVQIGIFHYIENDIMCAENFIRNIHKIKINYNKNIKKSTCSIFMNKKLSELKNISFPWQWPLESIWKYGFGEGEIFIEDAFGKNIHTKKNHTNNDNRIYFNIPFHDKDIFKKNFNGLWDKDKKKWYIYDCYYNGNNIKYAKLKYNTKNIKKIE